MNEQIAHVLNTATLWLLLGSSLRLATASGGRLAPVGGAVWQMIWCKDRPAEECMKLIGNAMDRLYIKLLAAVTSPASATLVYFGACLMGTGLFLSSTGALLRMVDYHPEAADVARWAGIPLVCLGIASFISATSERRTFSAYVSAAFILAGVGIGAVTGTMNHP